jgi:hypothetical protein
MINFTIEFDESEPTVIFENSTFRYKPNYNLIEDLNTITSEYMLNCINQGIKIMIFR